MPIHLTILLVFACTLCADPISLGALGWSGATGVSGYSTGENGPVSPFASTTSTGLSLGASESDQCCGGFANYSATTSFTVTLAGSFLFTSSAGYDTNASTCSDSYCPPVPSPFTSSGLFNGEFSASVEIVDSDGNEVFTRGFSSSGSAHYGNDCDFGDCFASLSLSDPDLGVVDLAAGTYTLEVYYSDSQNSIGESYGGSNIEANLIPNLSPIPEPSELQLLIAGMAVMVLIRVRHRNPVS